jgi:triosephosphate isomerase (TIM)
MKYFIGNWKMFGVPSSLGILKKINNYVKNEKNNKNYQVIIAPPFTLIESFCKFFRKKSILIGSQNCYHKDPFSSDTGSVSSHMVKKLGAQFVIIGHSDNRKEGDTDTILKQKIEFALKNNLKVIFCIGENKTQKNKKQTFLTLKKQITKVLDIKFKKNNIIVAYEPIWSIGTGKLPQPNDLSKTVRFIKKTLSQVFKSKKPSAVLYGGSVDGSSVNLYKNLQLIDGFLIGGASKSSKKFIDILKNYYR